MNSEKREVFISYHTSSSAEAVRKICAALEGAGITCWYAPRNVGANYAQSIVEAIRGCRVFLLILNEQSNLSAHVLNEINCAFDRFRNREDITLLPFRISECTLSDDVYYYLGRIHIMDGTMPPEVMRIQELVDRICMHLSREPQKTLVLSHSEQNVVPMKKEQTYRITNSMVYPDKCFVGRETELKAIHEQMSGGENKLFLVGMGGIGKSEVAKMYLKRYASDYDVILWISFERSLEQTVIHDYRFQIDGMSRMDYPEDSDREYYERKMTILRRIADRRVLLVIDNYDVLDDPDLEDFCRGAYGVLFTTRFHPQSGSMSEVEIGAITDPTEQMNMFRTEYGRVLDKTGEEFVDQILKVLDGHPLSIRLVASAMKSRRISPDKMLMLLREGSVGMAAQNAKAADIIFGRLRQVFRLSTLTEEELFLLKNLSMISLRGIQVEQLYEWCGADDFDVIDTLIQRSWVIHNPATDVVHLHPLVADLMGELVAQDPESCQLLLENLVDACSYTEREAWERKLELYDYAQTAAERFPKNHSLYVLVVEACAGIAAQMARFKDSEELYRKVLQLIEDPAKKPYLYHKISHAQVMGGDNAGAIKTALEGYEMMQQMDMHQLPVSESYMYKVLLQRLGEAYRELDEHDLAIQYGRKAVEVCDQFAFKDPEKSKGWAIYHLAHSLYRKGDLDESEFWLQKALELFESVEDRWSTAYVYQIRCKILIERGAYEQALENAHLAKEVLLTYYGSNHHALGTNQEMCGDVYRAMKNKSKAMGCYEQAIEILAKYNRHKRVAEIREKMKE